MLMIDPPEIFLSCTHTHKSYYLVTVNMRWVGCLGVISGREGVKGMCALVWFLCACVRAVLCLIDILPHSCPVGHRKGRQMAVFRSTTGQHMAQRDKVCLWGRASHSYYAWVEEVEWVGRKGGKVIVGSEKNLRKRSSDIKKWWDNLREWKWAASCEIIQVIKCTNMVICRFVRMLWGK